MPAWLEINANARCWIQKVEVEDQRERCFVCNKEGHLVEVCLIGPKGKSVDSSLELVTVVKFADEEKDKRQTK